MAAMSRAVFPPILKTVSLPTWSALGKSARNSTNEPTVAGLSVRYQCTKPGLAFGCLAANSWNRAKRQTAISLSGLWQVEARTAWREGTAGSGRQTGCSLHELPHVATNRQELLLIHRPDDVADDGRHDPLDTAHSKLR